MQKADERRVDAFEMWFYRRVLRIPWTERKTNAWVLDKIGNRLMLRERVRRRKLRFFGHVIRRKGLERLTIITGKVNGKRKRGRPPTSWLNCGRSRTSRALQGWHCKMLWEQQRIGRDGEESWKPQHRTTRHIWLKRESIKLVLNEFTNEIFLLSESPPKFVPSQLSSLSSAKWCGALQWNRYTLVQSSKQDTGFVFDFYRSRFFLSPSSICVQTPDTTPSRLYSPLKFAKGLCAEL